MSKNYYVHNPSYYRSHQYAHQYNLPDSAMNNRKMPLYTTEMPQGNDPFLPSHKKHFQRVGYRSIISEEQLINHQSEDQTNSPSKNKDYYRNLSIEDIEGASTNTLISQALKNRIKAKEHYLRRQRQEKRQQEANSIRFTQDSKMKQQALRRLKVKNSEQNYHKSHSFKTEGSDHNPSYHLSKQPETNKISQYKQQIEQAQRDIQQLQRKLNAAKESFDPIKRQKLSFEQKRAYKQEREHTNNSNLMLPKIATKQKDKLSQQRQIRQDRKRSHTQPNQNQEYAYPQSDKIKQQFGQHKHHKDLLEQSRLRRVQIRKLNPTYLSYGTYATNNSAKKVYL